MPIAHQYQARHTNPQPQGVERHTGPYSTAPLGFCQALDIIGDMFHAASLQRGQPQVRKGYLQSFDPSKFQQST